MKYYSNYIILILLMCSCNVDKYVSYKETINKVTTIVFSKSFHFNVEVLYLVKKVNNKKILSYQINCTDTKISKGVYLIVKKEYSEPNKSEELVCLLDSGMSRISDNINYRDLKIPNEITKVTEQDIDLIEKLLNKFDPPNKHDIVDYLIKCIGFAQVRQPG